MGFHVSLSRVGFKVSEHDQRWLRGPTRRVWGDLWIPVLRVVELKLLHTF